MRIFAMALVWLGTSAFTQTFDTKVVGVHDGDTITVYDGREQTRIRLDGIDCPENGTDFSQRAKQFTSDLVFGKQVRIEGKETDRYGRLVARGRQYLLETQLDDGSWPETTRPAGQISYAQYISTTGWALLALLASQQ